MPAIEALKKSLKRAYWQMLILRRIPVSKHRRLPDRLKKIVYMLTSKTARKLYRLLFRWLLEAMFDQIGQRHACRWPFMAVSKLLRGAAPGQNECTSHTVSLGDVYCLDPLGEKELRDVQTSENPGGGGATSVLGYKRASGLTAPNCEIL